MEGSSFSLKWKKDGRFYKKKMNRQQFLATFEGIVNGFPVGKNENAKKLMKIIPKVESININFEEKENLDYVINNRMYKLSIDSSNKVIWAILDAYCKDGKESKFFVLKWQKAGKYYEKSVEREECMNVFKGLIMTYPDRCEISKKIVVIIPIAEEVYIDWDSTNEIKSLFYKSSTIQDGLSINYHHYKVWEKLRELCSDGKEIEELNF